MTDIPYKDFNPKHRVVGAIVLVAIAVIGLPMILDRGEDGGLPDDPAAPAVENKVFVADLTRSNTKTRADSAPASAFAAPASGQPAPASTTPPKTDTDAALAPRATPKTAVPESRNTGARAPAPTDKGFYVQVGIFSSRANARQLADRLKQHGYRVQLEQVDLPSGGALRVRVGPYAESAQAQAARTAIQRKLDVQGIVRTY